MTTWTTDSSVGLFDIITLYWLMCVGHFEIIAVLTDWLICVGFVILIFMYFHNRMYWNLKYVKKVINIVSETLKLVIFNGKCYILLELSVKIHRNLYYWIKMQRKPFTANLIMVPSWHFGVSSIFFQVYSGRNGRKWGKPLSSSFFRMPGRNVFLPEETQPWVIICRYT